MMPLRNKHEENKFHPFDSKLCLSLLDVSYPNLRLLELGLLKSKMYRNNLAAMYRLIKVEVFYLSVMYPFRNLR